MTGEQIYRRVAVLGDEPWDIDFGQYRFAPLGLDDQSRALVVAVDEANKRLEHGDCVGEHVVRNQPRRRMANAHR